MTYSRHATGNSTRRVFSRILLVDGVQLPHLVFIVLMWQLEQCRPVMFSHFGRYSKIAPDRSCLYQFSTTADTTSSDVPGGTDMMTISSQSSIEGIPVS